jgi:hypothetical protein
MPAFMSSINNRSNLFWIFNICGWLLLNLIYLVLYYRNSITDLTTITLLFATYFTGFWVSVLLRWYYIKINFRNLSIPYLLLTIIVGSIAAAYVWFWIDTIISTPLNPTVITRYTFNNYLSHGWSNSFVTILWSALYLSLNFWFDSKEQDIKIKKANELAHSAQLQMLRYQLNPHFLFNSLNSIRALVEEDKKKAKSMITELSEFLRYSLVSRNFSDVPLRDELEAMQHYFAIEKTRYEEKLEVKFNIDPEANDFPVLSFLLHPVFENAIKYGMKSSKLPLKVVLNAEVKDSGLIIRISNTGKWLEPEILQKNSAGTGTGLNNVRQRLANAFPNKHTFDIVYNEEEVTVRIEIEKQA